VQMVLDAQRRCNRVGVGRHNCRVIGKRAKDGRGGLWDVRWV
jgi:hypothetical protein